MFSRLWWHAKNWFALTDLGARMKGATSRVGASGPATVEILERRAFLSLSGAALHGVDAHTPSIDQHISTQAGSSNGARVGPRAAPLTSWPTRPFRDSQITHEIYVNPPGNARLSDQSFASRNDVKIYLVYFDDPGVLTVLTSGTARVDMAVYVGKGGGRPDKVSNPGAAHPKVSVNVASKQPCYVAVRSRDSSAQGTFSLVVNGVAHNIIRPIDINPRRNSGHWLTTISDAFDADDYHFKVPVGGNWHVTIAPTGPRTEYGVLDATLIVYDKKGNPIAGSYTAPLDAGGVGHKESWVGHLRAGTEIIFRVDGRGASEGWYSTHVSRLKRPVGMQS